VYFTFIILVFRKAEPYLDASQQMLPGAYIYVALRQALSIIHLLAICNIAGFSPAIPQDLVGGCICGVLVVCISGFMAILPFCRAMKHLLMSNFGNFVNSGCTGAAIVVFGVRCDGRSIEKIYDVATVCALNLSI